MTLRLPLALPLAVTALAALTTATALPAAAETGIKIVTGMHGKMLTDAKGMTLYTFDKDMGGSSSCYDACATLWPPLIAPAGAQADAGFGLTERKDGKMQWTYDGKPLYLWSKDAKPGDTTGDGVKEVWHVAKPAE